MTTAILRTPRADQQRTYNEVEFAATSLGVRIAAYVAPDARGTFRGLPVMLPSDLSALGVDLVVAPTSLLAEDVTPFIEAGWPAERLLSFATQQAEVRERWGADSGGLAWRRHGRTAGVATPGVHYMPMDGVDAGDQAPALPPDQLRAITGTVFAAYRRAVADAPASGPYAVGHDWGALLRTTRPTFYSAAARGDVETVDRLLASFLRNELTTGTFGGRAGFENYVQAGDRVLNRLRKQHRVWACSVKTPDLSRVVSPAVGNPFGVKVGPGLVHANTFMNDCRAQYADELLGAVERPIVLDLGGGFGGFGHQFLSSGRAPVYVDVDLPENLLVASYFLMAANPGKRVLLYESRDQVLDAATLRQYDIVLLPNFMLPQVADRAVNLFTNFISLSEMDYPSIVEYLRQVDRVTDGFFYHENVIDNGVAFDFHPVSAFPALPHFTLLWNAPSRWPMFSPSSSQHCHGEFLAARRDLDVSAYLRAGGASMAPGSSAAA